jgi:oxygen-independent coproporphyrinogen III oxidase
MRAGSTRRSLQALTVRPAMTGDIFDPQQIARHDRSGPRYTSYPAATQFRDGFGVPEYAAAVRRSLAAQRPLSLYVHIPFCSSPCFYCGCNRVITRQPAPVNAYLRRLEQEIALAAQFWGRRAPPQQLHFGGGTPSYLSLDQLGALMRQLDAAFGLSEDETREYAIEIDPRALDADTLPGLAALGFNRISVGVQDFDADVQRAVNRVQSVEQVAGVVRQAREYGFGSVSFDLILGLPRQTPASFARTLDQALALAPDRFSVYSYAHLPALFPAQRKIRLAELPDAGGKLALMALTVERLTAAGYVHIGMDHFARPDDELARAARDGGLQRNFQGYSTLGGADLVGLGVSAISRIDDIYCQNDKTLDGYGAALDTARLPLVRGLRLSRDDRLRRDVIESIMCRGAVDCAAVEREHGIVFHERFADALDALQPLVRDGLIELDAGHLQVTPRGRYLLRAVAMPFDAYLGHHKVPQSRAI